MTSSLGKFSHLRMFRKEIWLHGSDKKKKNREPPKNCSLYAAGTHTVTGNCRKLQGLDSLPTPRGNTTRYPGVPRGFTPARESCRQPVLLHETSTAHPQQQPHHCCPCGLFGSMQQERSRPASASFARTFQDLSAAFMRAGARREGLTDL